MLGRITTAGIATEFPIPTMNSRPFTGMTVGTDQNIWFIEVDDGKLAFASVAGAVTEISLPDPSCQPLGIVATKDSSIWFTEFAANRVGRLRP